MVNESQLTGDALLSEFIAIAEHNRHAKLPPTKRVPESFPIARCRVETYGGDLYQPMEGGLSALVVIIWSSRPYIPAMTEAGLHVVPGIEGRRGSVIDLSAIDRRGDRAFLRRGTAICLGEHWMGCLPPDRPLYVVLSPTAWIEGGGVGVCPVDHRAFARWCLARPRLQLNVGTRDDRIQLERLLIKHRTPLPTIRVQALDQGLAA